MESSDSTKKQRIKEANISTFIIDSDETSLFYDSVDKM